MSSDLNTERPLGRFVAKRMFEILIPNLQAFIWYVLISCVYRMEDILEIYQKPYDPLHPVVCMDESMKQHTKEVVRPRFVSSGKPYCYDYEYDERNGVSHLFMYYEPFKGYRRVYVEKVHTKREWFLTMKSLMEECYSQARKVTVVMDNLATHQPSAFYEFLCPEEAGTLLL